VLPLVYATIVESYVGTFEFIDLLKLLPLSPGYGLKATLENKVDFPIKESPPLIL
jgi:hypothetical protein